MSLEMKTTDQMTSKLGPHLEAKMRFSKICKLFRKSISSFLNYAERQELGRLLVDHAAYHETLATGEIGDEKS